MRRFALFTAFLFVIRIAYTAELMAQELSQELFIDPLLSAYLGEGHHLKATIAIEDGKLSISGGFKVLTREGEIAVEGSFSRGRLEGDLKVYSDGRIVTLERYRDGKRTGDSIEWDESGRIAHVTHYDKDGEKTGTEVGYSGGIVAIEIDWEHGRPLEKRRLDNGKIVERVSGKELLDLLRVKARKEIETEP